MQLSDMKSLPKALDALKMDEEFCVHFRQVGADLIEFFMTYHYELCRKPGNQTEIAVGASGAVAEMINHLIRLFDYADGGELNRKMKHVKPET